MKKRTFQWLNTIKAGLPALIALALMACLDSLTAKAYNYNGLNFEIINGSAYITGLDDSTNSSYAPQKDSNSPMRLAGYETEDPNIWFDTHQREITVPETITYNSRTYVVRGFYVSVYYRIYDRYTDDTTYNIDLTLPETLNLPATFNSVYYDYEYQGPHSLEYERKTETYSLFTYLSTSSYPYLTINSNVNINYYGENGTYASIDGIVYNSDFSQLEFIPRGRRGEVNVLPDVKGISGICATGTNITKLSLLPSVPAEISSRMAPAKEEANEPGNATIQQGAFKNCKMLTEVTIPNGVLRIDDEAFANCSSLKTVTTTSLQETGRRAFSGCLAFEEFVTPAAANVQADQGVLFSKGLSTVIKAPNMLRTLTLPSTTREILMNAFSECQSLQAVTLNEGLDRIDDEAFSDVTELRAITLPSTIKEIGRDAFKNSGLITVTFNEGLERIGQGAFSEVNNLTVLNFPSSLNEIDNEAFRVSPSSASSVRTISFNDNLKSIGSRAFENNRLYSLTLPSQLEELGEAAFANVMPSQIRELEIPASLHEIKANAFRGTLLGNLHLHEGLQAIGDSAFFGSGLTALVLNNDLKRIGNHAFYLNPGITLIDLPDGLEKLGICAFGLESNDVNPRTIKLPKNLTEIPEQLFENNNIRSITWPENVKIIGWSSFQGAKYPENFVLDIPATVSEIRGYAFYSYPQRVNIKKLIIHNIDRLYSWCFYRLQPETIECINWYPPKVNEAPFDETTMIQSILYVPSGAGYYYQIEKYWRGFAHIEEMEFSGVEEIGAETSPAEAVTVNGEALDIAVAADVPVALFTIDGRTLYSGQGACTLTPGKGIFIVRIGNKTIKVCI